MPEPTSTWEEYYAVTKQRPPRPLLVRAAALAPDRACAIDVGAGALADTHYLLEQGFAVTAIDADPAFPALAQKIQHPKFHFVATAYEDFSWPAESFSLAAALFSLPFNPPNTFDRVWKNLLGSLKPGGIFCGQLFGPNDEWNTPDTTRTFHDRHQVCELLKDCEILELTEEEKDGPTATGGMKHWHIWHIIARKG